MRWRLLAQRAPSLALLTALASVANATPILNAEERLAAIRQGLVQAALDGATRVDSVVWLDAQGRLQESSSFRSGMQVRGVQVLAYLRDPEGQPQARLQLPDAAPAAERRDLVRDGVRHAGSASTSNAAPACPSSQGLRHLVGLDMDLSGRWTSHDAPMAHAFAELVQNTWLPSLPSAAGWRLLSEGEAFVRSGDEVPRSRYEHLLSGHESAVLPWRASLQVALGPQAPAKQNALWQPWLGAAPAAPVVARITLTLQPNTPSQSPGQSRNLRGSAVASDPVLTLAADVPLMREASQWGTPKFSPEGRARVLALLARWSDAISAQLACEPVRPEVVATPGSPGPSLRLNVGALAGVQPGEEWLLADPTSFPERLLAPGVAQQLVLVKVQRVGERHADVQVLAGPARPVQPGWRAWRAESPVVY